MEYLSTEIIQASDEDLCQLAASNDRMAEEQLVVRYMRLARACARPYFLSGGDSEDLIQEAMFGLLKAIREFDANRDASFRTFAEVCIRNRIKSAVAAASRDKHAPLNNSIPMDDEPLVEQLHDDGPEELFISREEEAERRSALNQKLSPLEHQILSLYLLGYSYREIGERTERSTKSVDNAIQRIRRKVEQG